MKKILILILLVSQLAVGRDILIGDKINLLISGDTKKEDLIKAFHAFEIDSITKTKDGTKVILRCYSSGKQIVEIKNKTLVFDIKSSLEGENTKIYPDLLGDSVLILQDPKVPWIFIIGCLIGSVSLILFLGKRNTTKPTQSAKERFYKGLDNNLNTVDTDYIYNISYLTREYTDYLLGSNSLSGKYENKVFSKELTSFFQELDRQKFTNKKYENRKETILKAKKLMEAVESCMKNNSTNNIKEDEKNNV